MIICERCGTEMSDAVAICPSCGTTSSAARSRMPSDYGQPSSLYTPPDYPSGYGQQQMYTPPQAGYGPPQAGYGPPPQAYGPQPGYNQPYNMPPPAYAQPVSVNVSMTTPGASGSANSAALIVEILLNLFTGIYGVGWLMAGETTAGVVLLICSLVLYWPIVIVGAILTLGLGLVCLIPLSIGGVILNAILLNSAVKRKATYVVVQSVQTFPPR